MAPPPPQRSGNAPAWSFVQVLANRPPPLTESLPSNPEIQPKTMYKGEIACLVTRKEAESLALHYQNALVGKFARGKPSMETLNELFKTIGFKGKFQLGSIDFRHVLIRFQEKEDYQRFWLKGHWIFKGASMKVLKWTIDFSPEAESSIVPVWIGNFIKMDMATTTLSRPSAVKLCVEVNVKKKLPAYIRVGIEEDGVEYNVVKLPIEFEDLPLYCHHCKAIGHDNNQCIYLHPELKKIRLSRKEAGVMFAAKSKHVDVETDQVVITEADVTLAVGVISAAVEIKERTMGKGNLQGICKGPVWQKRDQEEYQENIPSTPLNQNLLEK